MASDRLISSRVLIVKRIPFINYFIGRKSSVRVHEVETKI